MPALTTVVWIGFELGVVDAGTFTHARTDWAAAFALVAVLAGGTLGSAGAAVLKTLKSVNAMAVAAALTIDS
jgi:hypothetical protein